MKKEFVVNIETVANEIFEFEVLAKNEDAAKKQALKELKNFLGRDPEILFIEAVID